MNAADPLPPSLDRSADGDGAAVGRPYATGKLLDEVISQLYGAGLLIRAGHNQADPALVAELGAAADELDVTIRRLQRAAYEGGLLEVGDADPLDRTDGP